MEIKVTVTRFESGDVEEVKQAVRDLAIGVECSQLAPRKVESNWFIPEASTFEDLGQIQSNFGCTVNAKFFDNKESEAAQ